MDNRIHTIETPQPLAEDPQKIDFHNIAFKYVQTRSYAMYTSKNGEWSTGKLVENPYIPIHIACSALHYG